jgi:chromosome partitioning protein
MQVIAFMNMKGGVGKTTLAVNVAYAIAQQHGKNVLIVDGDPQFNATQCLVADDDYLRHISDPRKGTIRDIFIPRRPGPVSTTAGTARNVSKAKMSLADCTIRVYSATGKPGRLDLLPSTLSLVEAENSPRQTETRLKAYLREKALASIAILAGAAVADAQPRRVQVSPYRVQFRLASA